MAREKENLKPGYFNQKPLVKPVSELKFSIGLQDSCIQTNQAAVLFLEEQGNLSGDPEDFIKSLCVKYKISIGTRDLDYFKTIQYKSYILQTYNFVEPFFKDLNAAYRYYNNFEGKWKTKNGDKNLDPFNQLLANIDSAMRKTIKSYPEYFLLDYYRLIRNSIVHLQENEDEHEKTSIYYCNYIVKNLRFFKSNYELEAPNEPDKIGFADFMLYTRAIKYFSNILNDACFPEIETLVIVAKKDERLQKKLLQTRKLDFKGALLKRINVLSGYFIKEFDNSHKDLRDQFCKSYLTSENIDSSEYL
jgi:hypothetical protein